MPAITVTYTFTNSTTADATQVNTNFTDIINGTTSGTKSFDIGSLIVEGTSTFQGAVSLGDGTPDDIQWLGSLASTIPIKTNNTYNFGSSTLGLASVYLGGSTGSLTTRLLSGATGSSWSLTLPTTTGTSGQLLQTDGAGVTSWATSRRNPNAAQNYSLSTSVGTNAMTVNLLAQDGSTPSSTNAVDILFRNATAATGDSTLASVTGALSVIISSGATLGLRDAMNQYIYVWAMNNAGTVELCVSGSPYFDEGSLQSSSAISGSSTSFSTLYGTSGRSSKPIRLLGRVLSNQTTAGTYASNSTEISLTPDRPIAAAGIVYTINANITPGANAVIKFDTKQEDTHAAYSASTGLFTAPVSGHYVVCLTVNVSAGANFSAKVNGSALYGGQIFMNVSSFGSCSFVVNLVKNDTLGIYLDSGVIVGSANTLYSVHRISS